MAHRDPKQTQQQPPFQEPTQSHPGRERDMRDKPDHGETSYRGTGKFTGKHVLITGADSGIGRAVALAFAREGADVGIAYLEEHDDAKETLRLVTEAGRRGLLLPGDLADPSVCESIVKRAAAE